MTLEEILSRLEGVKGGNGQYSARCPAHDDHHASLSISSGKDGRILLNCFAGCQPADIVDALGLTMKDLFPNSTPEQAFSSREIVATYRYINADGELIGEKLRRADKSFTWRYPVGNGWDYHKPKNIVPYNLPQVLKPENEIVFLVEGEKDVDSMCSIGLTATCSPDGAGKGKWKKDFTGWFKGKHVFVIQDNDDVGKAYAQEEAASIKDVARSVKVLDLAEIWPGLPKGGDASDLIQHIGADQAKQAISELAVSAPEWTPEQAKKSDPFLSCFKTLDTFEEQEATWLVPGWIPEGQITLVAADGGIGKTTFWCNLVAAVSNGGRCILDPPEYTRKPGKVAFLTTEDSIRKKLKKKLRLAGVNQHNVIAPDFLEDKEGLLRELKFGTDRMKQFLRSFDLVLCIFDPVQGFVPADVNMGSRNAMRDCMAPLISLGEECGTTFLVVCHTNKRKGAWGRDRIADSADLWDIARSVIMGGKTEENGVHYFSNEKNNYARLQETVLFRINEEEQIIKVGTSWKRDREYMQEAAIATSAPKREDCKAYILHALDEAGGTMLTNELEQKAKTAGYASKTIRNAKDELKASGEIRYKCPGSGKEKTWYTEKVGFTELPEDFPLPFPPLGQEHQEGQIKL